MPIENKVETNENRYGVIKRGAGVWFVQKIPENMASRDALFFAAYIVAALDNNGENFQEILRQVRKV